MQPNILSKSPVKSKSAKYKIVRNALEASIREGDFHTGERLPSERQLAAQFGVSHMTARHAVTDLVESELLERRPQSGIYVRPQTREKLSRLTLNLICLPEDSSITRSFLHLGTQEAARRGWRTRITRLHHGYERPLVRAVRGGEPSLVFLGIPALWSSLCDAMEHAAGRAALVGNRLDERGIPSVQADDVLAVQMAVKHLHEAGHSKIGLVSRDPDHPISSTQIAAWRSACAYVEDDFQRRLIRVESDNVALRMQHAHKAVSRYLAAHKTEVTAIIGLDDEVILGALAACHDAAHPVPHDMSLVNIGDSPLLQFARPFGVTAVDVQMQTHIEESLQMVEAALASTLSPQDRLRLVKPCLVKRDSVRPPALH